MIFSFPTKETLQNQWHETNIILFTYDSVLLVNCALFLVWHYFWSRPACNQLVAQLGLDSLGWPGSRQGCCSSGSRLGQLSSAICIAPPPLSQPSIYDGLELTRRSRGGKESPVSSNFQPFAGFTFTNVLLAKESHRTKTTLKDWKNRLRLLVRGAAKYCNPSFVQYTTFP